MGERLIARIVIGLSVLLVVSEIGVVMLYGVRFELLFLPFVIFLASLGAVFGLVLLKGSRPEIESVSSRRARAKKDEKVRKLLEGYDVDEEFLPGRRKAARKTAGVSNAGVPAVSKTYPRTQPAVEKSDPFGRIDPKLRTLAEGFGGYREMVQKIEAMDTVAFKRLQYVTNMQGTPKDQLLGPVKKALAQAAGNRRGVRRELDHDEMNTYIEQTLSGKNHEPPDGKTRYLDINANDFGGMSAPPPGGFSHKPRDVIEHFKESLRKK